jgi:hypothetical protein
MPLTPLQAQVALLLAKNRTEDSHLAGGAALHHAPNGLRYSNDLDYFHDSVQRVTSAFEADKAALENWGASLRLELNHPGYVRAIVALGTDSTKIEWAHDSAWRFMPVVQGPYGFQLHTVDLAINKVLALAGRDEARDILDTVYAHERILPLGALCWAAAGKDPGFTPHAILDLLRRRAKVRPEELRRLQLAVPVDPTALKSVWLQMLDEATAFVAARPAEEMGCLYYDASTQRFVQPVAGGPPAVPHFGRPGGVLPRLVDCALVP